MSCLSNVQLEVDKRKKTPLSSSTGNYGWGIAINSARHVFSQRSSVWMSDSNTSNPVFAECHVARFWLRFLCLVLSTLSKLYHSSVCGLNSSFGLLLVDS